jgi:LRP1 type putative zinc finger protein
VKGRLPPEIRAQALFKCVQLPGVEDGENEFAYQATVKIGGHVFKGVLYNQGMDNGGSSALQQQRNVADLQLGGRSMPSSSALIDPTNLYGNPGSALLGGENFNDIRTYNDLRGD